MMLPPRCVACSLARAYSSTPRARPLSAAYASALQAAADLMSPAAHFSLARELGPRRIILHVGPTNSGKTHAALKSLLGARRGLYCSPLRLLAWEIFERLRAEGKPCELATGQERETWAPSVDASPRAGEKRRGGLVTAATIEMASIDQPLDVVVIDEIQMIADVSRGWAWTRVLLGAPASTVHLCGDAAAEPLVKRLAALTGDSLEVRRYERLTSLTVEREPVRTWRSLQPGDAVVAFSRRSLFTLKREIETTTGNRCAIVFGSLPPSVRRAQAALFNGGGLDAAPILLASDAIGMGLNLAIRRVIFTAIEKFDGRSRRRLNISEMKQIGGRAGRFGGAFSEEGGLVAATDATLLSPLRDALSGTTPQVSAAGLAPTLEQLRALACALAPRVGLGHDVGPTESDARAGASEKTRGRGSRGAPPAAPPPPRSPDDLATAVEERVSFSSLLRLFSHSRTTSDFFMCDVEDVAEIADLIDAVPLPFRDRHTFSLAPVSADDELEVAALRRYAKHFVARGRVGIGLKVPPAPPSTPAQLATLESVHSVFELYVWLARRFSVEFPFLNDALARAAATQAIISRALDDMSGANLSIASQRVGGERKSNRKTGRALRDRDYLSSMADGAAEEDQDLWFPPTQRVRSQN